MSICKSHSVVPMYSISRIPLENLSHFKDLGISYDSSLSFKIYLSEQIRKCNFHVRSMFQSFKRHGNNFYVYVFTTYIRPSLEFSTPFWSPSQRYLIEDIEKVQRGFTRRLLPLLPEDKRLENLKLSSLEERRLRFDLVALYRV